MSSMYIHEPRTSGKVLLKTSLGDIDVELWAKECPLACRNFVQLCMEGFYDNTIFHRLQKDFMVQGGDPTGTGDVNESIYGEPFKTESHQRLQFNRRGLLGCAGEKDNCGSQFFFTLGSTPELYKKHTLFGKITGNTIFNLMRFNEHEVDKNERPVPERKILSTQILENPFKDIVPRTKNEKTDRKEKKEKREKKVTAVKNTSLLSFGDEAEEDEQELVSFNKKLKGKSAHDVLNDEKLSKQAAVNPEELSTYQKDEEEDDDEEREARLKRIQDKFKKGKRKNENVGKDDDDIEAAMVEEKRRKIDDEKAKLASEYAEITKSLAKSLRGPKMGQDGEAEESVNMKEYRTMKLKFKKGTHGIVKQADPQRESQTMALLDLMKTRLSRSSVQGVMRDQKVDMSDLPKMEEIILSTSEDQGKLQEDAEDMTGEEWMKHKLVAPEDTSGVTKAKDANRRDTDEEWYPMGDPRNKIAQRRREGALDI
uniref:PPIase cyclophilin-type domain-containing protein n=1 Tax=Panagrolaimus sp. JU765 TaxID=591449 RepID=A0AC34QNB4_9BILA